MKIQQTCWLSLFCSLSVVGDAKVAGAAGPLPQTQKKEVKVAEQGFSGWYKTQFNDKIDTDKKGRKVQFIVLRHSKSLDTLCIKKKYQALPDDYNCLVGKDFQDATPDQLGKLRREDQGLEAKLRSTEGEKVEKGPAPATPTPGSAAKVPPAASNQGSRRAEVAFEKWYKTEFDNKLDKDKKGREVDVLVLRHSPGNKEMSLKKVYIGNMKPERYVLSPGDEFKSATPEQLAILIDEEQKLAPQPKPGPK
jgi:hypothetical protein